LRLYSQEDIDRLRVIKHFVEDLGLNLAGVQLALTITARLLKLRAELGTVKEPSPMDPDPVLQIDKILGDLRLRVTHEGTPKGTEKELPAPQMNLVEFHRGEKLEFLR
jgi:DNA-binding transcriptional MerR regulator